MDRIPYIAIACALALVYIPRAIVGSEMKKLAGGYDNNDPRGQQAQLTGRGKRALGAHQNGFEAFAPFSVAVLLCLGRVNLALLDGLAIAFVVCRALYVVFYVGDQATPRSAMWTLGQLAIGALLVSAIIGA